VAHSLGGLILKRTLSIAASSRNTNQRTIFRATIGLLFLGTPHSQKGEDIIKLFTTAGTLLHSNFGTGDTSHQKAVLPVLRFQSDFSTLVSSKGFHIKIVSFYEELPVPGYSVVRKIAIFLNAADIFRLSTSAPLH
jgi:hypothetical protein